MRKQPMCWKYNKPMIPQIIGIYDQTNDLIECNLCNTKFVLPRLDCKNWLIIN